MEIYDAAARVLQLRIVFWVPKLEVMGEDTIEALELQSSIAIGDTLTVLRPPSAIVLWGVGGGTFPALLYSTDGVVLRLDTPPIVNPTKCIVITGFERLQALTIFQALPQDDFWTAYPPQQWEGFGHCYRWDFEP